jgi:hypothetical protein
MRSGIKTQTIASFAGPEAKQGRLIDIFHTPDLRSEVPEVRLERGVSSDVFVIR